METYRIRYVQGSHAISAIKLVRDFTGVGLREAKDIVDNQGVILDQVSAAEARRVARKFMEIDARVEVERTWRYVYAFDPGHPARGDQSALRLRVGERELEREHGELGAWVGSEHESFEDPARVERRVVEQIAAWQREGLRVAQDEIELLRAVSARNLELEAALHRHPEDAERHLIYGDWLQAQGDPRGQWIALHHALAEHELQAVDDPSELTELRQRVDEFERAHTAHLYGPLRHAVGGLDLRWRLGMLDAAFVGPLEWTRHAGGPLQLLAALLALPVSARLQRLGIASALLGWLELDSVLAESEVVSQLRELELGDQPLTYNLGSRHFARTWPQLHDLRRLTICSESAPLHGTRWNWDSFADTLEHLELRMRRVGEHYSGLYLTRHMPQLRRLTIQVASTAALDPSGLACLVGANDRASLETIELRLPNGPLTEDQVTALSRARGSWDGIACLDLSGCSADERVLERLRLAQDRGQLPADLRLPVPV